MRWRRPTCWRTRAVQEGTVAVGDAAAGKVRRAFEDAGDGRGTERGGDENGGAREGELADVRQRCCKRQREPAACREAEAVRQDGTQQPAGADEEGGSRMDVSGGCATKGDARRRRRDKRRSNNQPANSKIDALLTSLNYLS